ncbi:MAG: bifunctional 4-hydroxy-2-oxoglutarate aldolase/2-dehydro-3-deoxy-phosphogluconate aldolase [Bacteroidota bacterium]|nr:bifunctional 4-hydroxy-2-oxoglutarate aldolase/2-dehydro-3-deoxy-phosphogluconate aldolase [Bacteroidota bacterium]
MNKKSYLLKLIPEQGILPLYFHKDAEVSVEVLKALYGAGIRTVEYTNRGENALHNFKKMREVCDKKLNGMYLGIGTIKNGAMAEKFITAGADFIISPGLIEEVAKIGDQNNLLWIPGCMTPTEIIRAENLGAKMIKLFPGNILGTEFMSAIKPLFPDLLFMPTGGVDLDKENIAGWLKAGVCAVGMGSKLISTKLMDQNNYVEIEAIAKQAMDILRSLR